MNGLEIQTARKELGWTRQKMLDRINSVASEMGVESRMTLSHLAVIEQGKREPHPPEERLIRQVLLQALGKVITEEVPIIDVDANGAPLSAVTVTKDGAHRSYEWRGLRHGDVVRVKGLRGRYKFLYHHLDDRQEYVEISGPLTRVDGRVIGTAMHSVTPDRIQLLRR
jgi:transcriptional regulator with XRE-family HTH domain